MVPSNFPLLFLKENISIEWAYLSWLKLHIISVKGAALVRPEIKWYRWNKMLTPLRHSCNIFICICCKFVLIELLWCLHNVTCEGIRFLFWHYAHQSITPRRRENPNLGELWMGYNCQDIYKSVYYVSVDWTHKTHNVPDAIYQSLKVIMFSFLLKITEKSDVFPTRESGDSFLQFSTSTPTAGSFHVSSNLKKKNNPKVKSADVKVRAMLLRLQRSST